MFSRVCNRMVQELSKFLVKNDVDVEILVVFGGDLSRIGGGPPVFGGDVVFVILFDFGRMA